MATNKPKNTVVMMELADGTEVKLTLAYRYLMQLSTVNKKVYAEYNAVWNKKEGQREELDNIKVLYAAYLCAAIQDGTVEQAMGFEDFLDAVSTDREITNNAMLGLVAPKRVGATATPSA